MSELVTPVHLDYTTLYGAALAVEPKEFRAEGIKLSRLLSLSQLVEALVLHENIQFEVGATKEWEPYNEALQSTALLQVAPDLGLPLAPAVLPIDSEEKIIEAFQWACEQANKFPVEFIDFAVRHRPGSYSSFPRADRQSPMVSRYFRLAKEADGRSRLATEVAIRQLASKGVDRMGLYVMARLRLLQQYFESSQEATYCPHYSRQPLVISACDDAPSDVHEWTMELLREKRKEILSVSETKCQPEPLAEFLSPVFVACISQAQQPLDILENAIELRHSAAAEHYRAELFELLQKFAMRDQEAVQRYKFRLYSRLKDLNDLLFERGIKRERVSQWSLTSILQAGWSGFIRNTQTVRDQPGDQSVTLLSDVLSHSLGTLQAEAKIADVFGSPIVADCPIVGLSKI